MLVADDAAAGSASASLADGVARVSLIDGWRNADGDVVAGIAVELAPGWHTYWRNPGDIGMPPSFDWSGSRNLAGVSVNWPTPKVFENFGDRSIGYDRAVVLPITLTPVDRTRPIDLTLGLMMGVCAEVCVPDAIDLGATFGPLPRDPDPAPIRAAFADRARTAGEAGVDMTCGVERGPDGLEVTATVNFNRRAEPVQIAVIESSQSGLWIGAAEIEARDRVLIARAPIEVQSGVVDRGELSMTLIGAEDAIEIEGCDPSPPRLSAAR